MLCATIRSCLGGPRLFLAIFVRVAAAALLTICLAAAARAEDAAGCQNPPAKHAVDPQWPINIGVLAQQLVVYRCTDYINDMAAVLDGARAWIEKRAPEVEKPAIVFDIDETSLSNWEAIYHNHFAFAASGPCDLAAKHTLCGNRAWELSARAVALQPTLAFYRLAKTLKDKNGDGVAIFFVTGRTDDSAERTATEENLRKAGYGGWDKLILRPRSSHGPVSIYKSGERKQIAEQYRIIANVGDQYSDLIGDPDDDHAERCFKLPNPFYFIPPGMPEAGLKCLAH
jgi:putative acid phosphatase of HAD superfamily subfamily IIIB